MCNRNRNRNYTMTCASGTVVLVRGKSAAEVEAEWDAVVAAGSAEPRIDGTTEPASASDVRACIARGHDYR